MGSGGPFLGRPAGAWRSAGVRVRRMMSTPFEADEAPHPEWRPCGDRLSGRRCSTSTFAHEAMAVALLVGGFLRQAHTTTEIRAGDVKAPPGEDLRRAICARDRRTRFANPKIEDTDPRGCVAGRLQPAAEIHPADRISDRLSLRRRRSMVWRSSQRALAALLLEGARRKAARRIAARTIRTGIRAWSRRPRCGRATIR